MSRKGRDMISSRKTLHHLRKPQLERITKIWIFNLRSKGLSCISGIPAPRSCTGERSSQNIWLWKPMRNISRKTIELQGMKNLFLKCLHTDSTWKSAQNIWPIDEGDPLPNLKVSVREKLAEILPGGWDTGRSHFVISGYFDNARTEGQHFGILPINC